MHLPNGLGATRVTALSDLIAQITGIPLASTPYLAPALLFATPEIQQHIGMPTADSTSILIHDYQAITVVADLHTNIPLSAQANETKKDTVYEYDFALFDDTTETVNLTTALRLFPRQDLSTLKPTQFRNIDKLADIALQDDLRISQAQTDAYQALSGDMNPIHHDPAEAATLGLPAPIVPGLLLAATVQPILENARPSLRLKTMKTMKTRFMAPLCVNDPYKIALQDRGNTPQGDRRIRAYIMRPDASALAVADLTVQPLI